MSRAINAVIGHWQATRGQRHSMTAFAHGDQPGIEIWWGPWRIGEQDRVFGTYKATIDGERKTVILPPAAYVRILVVKAEDQEGKRLFSDIEEIELLNEANYAEVQRVATAIFMSLITDNAVANKSGAAGDGDGGEGGGEPAGPKAGTSGT